MQERTVTRRTFLQTAGTLTAAWALGGRLLPNLATAQSAPGTKAKPSIVFILADDLGYGDPGCYNEQTKIPMPAMDRLAREGVRFTDAHTPSAVCTPTRYGILTGRYCWRSSLKSGVLGGYSKPLIETDRLTVASLLKRHGYTTGCIGKWHLGLGWITKDSAGKPAADTVDWAKTVTHGPQSLGFRLQLYHSGLARHGSLLLAGERPRRRGPDRPHAGQQTPLG